jgi:hypothetical protein
VSIYHRTYIARVAPASTDWREAIRNGVQVIDDGRTWLETFADDAFLPDTDRVPVLLGHHRTDKPVGWIASRTVHNGWHVAAFTLDHSRSLSAVALDRLRVGAPVSIGAESLRRDKQLIEDGVMRHTLARFDELTIVAPNEQPAYRGAQITQILESPAARGSSPSDRAPAAAGEVVLHGGEKIRRVFENVTIRVR